ncbi:MAG: aminotransferase class III-fold pyridoxal phosphate-dependent enzyme [Actinobacteria bacterium]|nr:aminotransferase class III-fold pyridoxal phosphate-dependent enzyme [Actinomycetota bacterium]
MGTDESNERRNAAEPGSSGRPRPRPIKRTEIPGPASREWIDRDRRSESGGNAYPDFFGTGVYSPIIESAEGSLFVDADGNSFVESSGAFSCATFGYAPGDVIAAAVEQMQKLAHVPDLPTGPRIELAEKLRSIAPGDLKDGRVQFDLGGAGAMDLAYKLAYFHSHETKPHSAHKVITFAGAYHGRTTTTSQLTGSAHAQEGMPHTVDPIRMPFPYCYRCPFGQEYPSCGLACAQYVRQQFEHDAWGVRNPRTGHTQATIMLWEPIQAHIGMIFPPQEFMRELRSICDDYGVTLVDDEVCMGIGHTGNWFAAETYETVPDVLATSKALTAGVYPLSAVIAKDEIWAPWGAAPDKHMGSYHGNPVGCAAGLKNIELMEERDVLTNVRAQGAYAAECLADLMARHEIIGEAKNVGLAIGIELVRDRATKEPAEAETVALVKECLDRGLLVLRLGYHGNRLNLMPPLDSSRAEMDFIFDTLDESLGALREQEVAA